MAKRWKLPLDGRTARSGGGYGSFPKSNAPGFHGHTRDSKTGKWYAVYGNECAILGCHCDRWVEEIPDPSFHADCP